MLVERCGGQASCEAFIATLTALMLGYKTATKLQRLGRIEGEERAVRLLDDVLLHEAPYISDYI